MRRLVFFVDLETILKKVVGLRVQLKKKLAPLIEGNMFLSSLPQGLRTQLLYYMRFLAVPPAEVRTFSILHLTPSPDCISSLNTKSLFLIAVFRTPVVRDAQRFLSSTKRAIHGEVSRESYQCCLLILAYPIETVLRSSAQ